MNYLFIDTSSTNVVVAIVKDTNIVSCFNKKVDLDLSVNILPIISKIFDESKMVPNDIDTIFVVNGPGSFTGIRIGVTIAKTYAWSLKKKIIPISSLEFIATTRVNEEYIIPLIDARRGYVYAGIYDSKLNIKNNDEYISLEELTKKAPKNSIYVSYDDVNIDHIKPNVDVVRLIQKHINDKDINAHILNPNYLKMTEAEENLCKEKV